MSNDIPQWIVDAAKEFCDSLRVHGYSAFQVNQAALEQCFAKHIKVYVDAWPETVRQLQADVEMLRHELLRVRELVGEVDYDLIGQVLGIEDEPEQP